MSEMIFREDAYRTKSSGVVLAHSAGGVVLDRSLFYPTGGGQPGDRGRLSWEGGDAPVLNTLKGEGDAIVLLLAEGVTLPAVGERVHQTLDWDLRYRFMRIHTALHLLSVVIPLPVSGGAISEQKGRLDFNMPDPLDDKDRLAEELNALIARDLAVSVQWITDAELDADPGLVKTMSVSPPRGSGRIRLIQIGAGDAQVDLQPCGGTHVARSGEIGRIRLGKVEKKGRENRRVNLHLEDL